MYEVTTALHATILAVVPVKVKKINNSSCVWSTGEYRAMKARWAEDVISVLLTIYAEKYYISLTSFVADLLCQFSSQRLYLWLHFYLQASKSFVNWRILLSRISRKIWSTLWQRFFNISINSKLFLALIFYSTIIAATNNSELVLYYYYYYY